eukprot:CAMPEP_0113939490 /NCGR_PEP_ID=MMETSP1339-20121228/5799_1 /TAXON_ID=94617 /ORGANISM="Fibrocapsa japonica" /LENGTH=374 /DNA_ID=CAMNT_0000943001 /DNA_START=44 /DNA_END=1165 /DNA_ORIENTATION=- /assembly_acc=CAM_ASM_000762
MKMFKKYLGVALLLGLQQLVWADHDVTVNIHWGNIDLPDLPNVLSDNTCTTVGDKIYLIGGCNGEQVSDGQGGYYCDSITDAVIEFRISNMGSTTLSSTAPQKRYRHAAVLWENEIYLFGGRDENDVIITAIDKFNPSTGSFEEFATWPGATSDLAAFTHDNKIFLAGGWNQNYEAQSAILEFHPDLATPQMNTVGNMLEARGDFTIQGPASDGNYFAIGGFTHVNEYCPPLASVERFDPETWTVEAAPNLVKARGDKAAAALNEKIHVIGGEECGYSAVSDVELLDVDHGHWDAIADIPFEAFRFCAAAWQNSIFIFGGQGKLDSASDSFPLLKSVHTYSEITVDLDEVSSSPALQVGMALMFVMNFTGLLLW